MSQVLQRTQVASGQRLVRASGSYFGSEILILSYNNWADRADSLLFQMPHILKEVVRVQAGPIYYQRLHGLTSNRLKLDLFLDVPLRVAIVSSDAGDQIEGIK